MQIVPPSARFSYFILPLKPFTAFFTKASPKPGDADSCLSVSSGLKKTGPLSSTIKDRPEAVLIRAVEPIKGLGIISKNRNIKSKKIKDLTNGPGKLSRALAIDKELNGYDLISGDELYIKEAEEKSAYEIVACKRVNIDYAEEYKEKLWRFYIKDNPYVSIL